MSILTKYLWSKIFEDDSTQQANKDAEYLQASEEATTEKENSAAERCKQSAAKLEETVKKYDEKAGTDPKNKIAEIDKDVSEFNKQILLEQIKILKDMGVDVSSINRDDDLKELKAAIKAVKDGLSKEKKDEFNKNVEESEDIKTLNKKIEGAGKKKDKLREEKEIYDAKKAQWAKYKNKLQEQVNKLKAVANKLEEFERKIKEFKQKRRVAEAKIKEAKKASDTAKQDRKEATKELINHINQQTKLAQEALEAKKAAIRADLEEKRQQAQIDAKEEAEKAERDAIQAALEKESEKAEDKIKDIENKEKEISTLNNEKQSLQNSLNDLQGIKTNFDTKKAEYDNIKALSGSYNEEGGENPLRVAAEYLVELNNEKNIHLETLKILYKEKYPDDFNEETFPTDEQLTKLSTEKAFKSTFKVYDKSQKDLNTKISEFKKECYNAQVATKKATGENCSVDLSDIELSNIVEGSVSEIAKEYVNDNSTNKVLDNAKNTATSNKPLTVKINGKPKKIYWVAGENGEDGSWKYKGENDTESDLTNEELDNITVTGAVEPIPTEKIEEPKLPNDLEDQISNVKSTITKKDEEINTANREYNELTGARLQTTSTSNNTNSSTNTQEEIEEIENKDHLQSYIDSITDENEKKEFLKSIGLKEEDFNENGKLKDDIDEKRLNKAIKKSNEEIEEIENDDNGEEYDTMSDEEAATDDEQHDDDKLGKDGDGKPQPPKRKIVKKTVRKRTKDGKKVKSTKYIAYTKDENGKTKSYESNEEDLKANQRAWIKYKKRYVKWKSKQNESFASFLKNNINESCNKSNLKKYLYSKL